MLEYKIIDNFLAEEDFAQIKNLMCGSNFPWFFQESVAEAGQEFIPDFYFTHLFYSSDTGVNSPGSSLVEPILKKINLNTLIRVKANMYPNVGKYIENGNHVDYPFDHKGAIFYINTNNGFTILEDGTKVNSVANRILFFDSSKPHRSTYCTDEKVRININFNYF